MAKKSHQEWVGSFKERLKQAEKDQHKLYVELRALRRWKESHQNKPKKSTKKGKKRKKTAKRGKKHG